MDKTEARAILAQNNLNSNPTPRAGFVQNGPKQQMQVTDLGNSQYNTFLFSSGGVPLHRSDIFYAPQHRPTKRVQFVKVEMAVASFLNTIVCPTLMQLKRKIPELL